MRWRIVLIGNLLLANGFALGAWRAARARGNTEATTQTRALTHTCLISKNVQRLTEFYERALQMPAHRVSDIYVEFPTSAGTLAIFDADAQEKYIPGSAEAGQNRSAILEFHVDNADEEYARLQGIVRTWVKAPTTQPWGTRSIYFRDPDGNLVDFYTQAKP